MEQQSYLAILSIVRKVRQILLPQYGDIRFTQKKSNIRQDLLTELDVYVEKFLKREFIKLFPDISFVGEETGGDRNAREYWLVDPIDGTSSFVRGLPFCTTQVALIKASTVMFTAIYDFVNDMMYSAVKGRGAQANDKPIRVSSRSLGDARLAWEMDLENPRYLQDFLELKRQTHLFHSGTSGIELALVACGKLDGLIRCFPANDYDIVPGTFLIAEAGGTVANIGSRDYDYRNGNFIATNPVVFKELTEGPDAIFPIHAL